VPSNIFPLDWNFLAGQASEWLRLSLKLGKQVLALLLIHVPEGHDIALIGELPNGRGAALIEDAIVGAGIGYRKQEGPY
jgi:hypothetical protein